MPTAIGVGLRASPRVFIVARARRAPSWSCSSWSPSSASAAVEFFDKVTEKGYRPASVVGIVACVATPLAAYWVGERAHAAGARPRLHRRLRTFIGATSLESAPMPNMAITTLGVVWIGLARLVRGADPAVSKARPVAAVRPASAPTRCSSWRIGVVANDIGALFVGSAAGKTPLRAWISPNKSVEGFIGGTVLTHRWRCSSSASRDRSDTWNSAGDLHRPRRRHRRHRAARRSHREHVQAQPRHQGLRHHRHAVTAACSTASTASCSRLPAVYYLAGPRALGNQVTRPEVVPESARFSDCAD